MDWMRAEPLPVLGLAILLIVILAVAFSQLDMAWLPLSLAVLAVLAIVASSPSGCSSGKPRMTGQTCDENHVGHVDGPYPRLFKRK